MKLSLRTQVPHVQLRWNADTLVSEFWGGECGIILKAINAQDEEIRIYPHNPHDAEHGGMEYARVLHSRPKSNVLKYSLDTWNLNVCYQPELASREKERSHRPDHVTGSFALYHKTKGGFVEASGPDYKTGKAAHLYRGWAQDARGWRVWTDYRFNPSTGILSQRLPEHFWRESIYPVFVDPTFGYTTAGGSSYENFNFIAADLFTLTENGTTVSMSMYGADGANAGALVQMAVYSKAATRVLQDNTGSVALPNFASPAFKTANLAGVSLSADDFNLAYNGQSDIYGFFDAGLTASYKVQTFGTWPGTFTNDGTIANHKFSVYCTYTAASSGGNPNLVGEGGTAGMCLAGPGGLA